MNTPIDYLSRYSFGHFCCRVKQGKRLSEFLQKYTDSGTETTHLAGYNILVFKYVKISAGLPLLFIEVIRKKAQNQTLHNLAMLTSNVLSFIFLLFFYSLGAIREKKLKIRYCIIWRCLHLMFSTTNVSDK